MERTLRNRLKLRHASSLELIKRAEELKSNCTGEGVSLQEVTQTKLKLNTSVALFEKESLKLAEVSEEEDQCILMKDQMKAEELVAELDTIERLYMEKTTVVEPTVSTKLPKLEIPKFDGDILKWPEFWDKFESSIHSRSMNNVDKLSYLFSALQSKALDALRGIDITNNNYSIALDILKKRFGNKNLVIDAHYDALTKLPKATEDNVRTTLDSILKHLRILEILGEDTTSNVFRNLICSKFPSKVIYELNLLTSQERSMSATIETLEKIVTAKERSMTLSTSCDQLPSATTDVLHTMVTANPYRKRKIDVPNVKHNFKRGKVQCMFCMKSHYSDQCLTYRTYAQRMKKLKDRCYKCFKTGHTAKACIFKISCYYCRGPHNRALCMKRSQRDIKKKPSLKSDKTTDTNNKPQGEVMELVDDRNDTTNCLSANMKSYLQTATAQIQYNNHTVPVRLLLDCGSQRSYITSRMAKNLNLHPDREDQLLIYTFGSDKPQEITSPSAEIVLVTKRGCQKLLNVNIVPHITDRVQVPYLKSSEDVDVLADDNSLGDGIDLLIGNNYYFSFLRNNYLKVGEDLYLVDSDFGWIISGWVSHEFCKDMSLITYCQCHGSDCPYFYEPDLPLRSVDIRFLWSLESIGIVDSPKATREEEAVKYFNKTVRYNNGRYEVKWPWIQYPPELPTNFGLAFGRLRSLLKRADQETLKDYQDIFMEQLKNGIIEVVEPQPIPPEQTAPLVHYLPHHIVKQTGKKGRIVYDASAKIREEKSLNECMYRGPSMLEDLTGLLLKFRTGKIGITADVEKAFLQISLQEEDRDVTRFLWVKDISKELSESNLIHYRFCRVPFGIIASPFLLTATIRHHLSNTNEILLKRIADRCYVDNLVTETKTEEEAYNLYQETKETFDKLSMNIRDWVSNNQKFMERIPDKHKSKTYDQVKVLGLIWNLGDDTLHLKVPLLKEIINPEKKTTKKDILKTLARLYDPCGFASPLILPAKMLFQETCERKLKWNSILPPELEQSWCTILEDLETVKDINIPRFIGYAMPEDDVKYELHCFTDASKNAYAAVVYILIRGKYSSVTAFLMSKSRITPIEDKNDLKIPRLELLGFLIGSRLLKYVAEKLEIPLEKKYLWTDSFIVLAWMKTSKLLPPFVFKRVNEIKQNKDIELRYVPTNQNPADIATRPEIIKHKTGLWFNGPDFLIKHEDEWPVQFYDERQVLFSVGEALDIVEGPEMSNKGYEQLEDLTLELDIAELNNVDLDNDDEMKTIRDLQLRHFPEEVSGKQTHLSRNLGLFLDGNCILRCKGRMGNADWTYDKKYPILIPRECEFTSKLIMETHEKNYHVGVSHTLSIIREKYWIPQGRAQVQKSLKRCLQCIKHGGGPYKLPPTPALPKERVNLTSPFSFTGMDYFGPVFVQSSGTKEKRWICLFTCLTVRAIHLEVVKDLTADECLMGLRRFIACKGKPNLITSDNATQFKLTSEILAAPFCVKNGIRWKFIPQLAPWYGGVYERLIGLVKNSLKRTLDKHLLQDGQLLTVIKEVEAVVNTRPLVRVGSEVEHVLKPADFLSLGRCFELTLSQEPRLEGTATKIDLLKSWKRGQAILDEFRKMFHEQYLPSLRERYCHHPKQPRVKSNRSPCIGDIVQVKEDSKNRNNWKVGKITALIKGPDGECRVAKVKVGDYELTRSIGHLYPLEAEVGRSDSDSVEPSRTEPLGMVPDMMEVDHPDEVEWKKAPNLIDVEQVELPQEVDTTLPDIDMEHEQASNDVLDHTNEFEHADIPSAEEEAEIADADTPRSASESREVNDDEPSFRAKRYAAVRAREKIAEWTRHLLAILQ